RLHVAAREVQVDQAVADREGDLQADGNVRHHVVLDVVRELVAPGRHAPDQGLDLAGRVVDQVVHRLVDGVGPEAADQLVQAPFPGRQPGHERLEIAPVLLGDAAVRQHHVEHVVVHGAAHEELLGRQPQAFLEDLGGARRDARRHHAADVGAVEETGPVGDQTPVPEDGTDQVDTGQIGGGGGQ